MQTFHFPRSKLMLYIFICCKVLFVLFCLLGSCKCQMHEMVLSWSSAVVHLFSDLQDKIQDINPLCKLALWTHKVLCISFFAPYIYKYIIYIYTFSFIHSLNQMSAMKHIIRHCTNDTCSHTSNDNPQVCIDQQLIPIHPQTFLYAIPASSFQHPHL